MYFQMQKIKYEMCRVVSSYNRVVELNQKMLILSKMLTNVFFLYFDNKTEFLINRSLHVEFHLK